MAPKLPEFGRFTEPSLLILVSLSNGPRHGYAIMQDVEAGTGRPMGPGTLYAALARLEERGFIEPLTPVDRRRPYRLTAFGAIDLAERLAGPVRVRAAGAPPARRDQAMTSLLIRLYPARWRARYGDEFEAILDERPLGPFDVADIVLGALDARLRLRGVASDTRQGRGIPMSLRVGGLAAVVGAALLAGAGLLSYDLVRVHSAVQQVMLFSGLGALLVAMAGLSAFQARIAPHQIWAAFAMTAIGTVVAAVGSVAVVLFGDTYWAMGIGGVFAALIGSALFAIATYRTAVLSRGAAVLLGIGSVLPFFSGNVQPLMLTAVVCYLLGWFALGLQAIRLDRPTTEPRPA